MTPDWEARRNWLVVRLRMLDQYSNETKSIWVDYLMFRGAYVKPHPGLKRRVSDTANAFGIHVPD